MSALQACFSQLNERDEAMSRSLTSDYLDQLLIKADTSGLIKIVQGCLAVLCSSLCFGLYVCIAGASLLRMTGMKPWRRAQTQITSISC